MGKYVELRIEPGELCVESRLSHRRFWIARRGRRRWSWQMIEHIGVRNYNRTIVSFNGLRQSHLTPPSNGPRASLRCLEHTGSGFRARHIFAAFYAYSLWPGVRLIQDPKGEYVRPVAR